MPHYRRYSVLAIPTRYAGNQFRSKTEARFAAFFDALGVLYRYEPRCFDLPVVGRYLPDFLLPSERVWVEIKPTTPTGNELLKCHMLADETGMSVVVLSGNLASAAISKSGEISWRSSVRVDCCHGRRDPDERVFGKIGTEWLSGFRHASTTSLNAASFRDGLLRFLPESNAAADQDLRVLDALEIAKAHDFKKQDDGAARLRIHCKRTSARRDLGLSFKSPSEAAWNAMASRRSITVEWLTCTCSGCRRDEDAASKALDLLALEMEFRSLFEYGRRHGSA